MERLHKYIAQCGIASRRASENLILQGKVKVNGAIVKTLGILIDKNVDKIEIDGKKIKQPKFVYYMLNKPVGCITTTKDRHAAKKITDLVPPNPKIFPVGRLDKNTSGLLILTNDGNFTYNLTHPKFEKEKEYIVDCRMLSDSTCAVSKDENYKTFSEIISMFEKGIRLTEGITSPAKITNIKMSRNPSGNQEFKRHCSGAIYRTEEAQRHKGTETKKQVANYRNFQLANSLTSAGSILQIEPYCLLGSGCKPEPASNNLIQFNIIIHEGWKRQIRRMCEVLGLEVIRLKRIRVGNLKLGNLRPGEWRKLNENEIKKK